MLLSLHLRVQCALGDDQAVRVVVDVGEAHAVLPVAKGAQHASPTGLEHVGHEEVVARAVHLPKQRKGERVKRKWAKLLIVLINLVRGHSNGHQLGAAGGSHGHLSHGLGLRIPWGKDDDKFFRLLSALSLINRLFFCFITLFKIYLFYYFIYSCT